MLKQIAAGGTAEVLLARSDGLEGFARHVVVKRIRSEHAHDRQFVQMFLDEARVAATLHHPHIVEVHDVGEDDGESFVAMEYVHGEPVRMVLASASKARAHVPLGSVIAIVSAAAAGLHHAHERRGPDQRLLGIVHRDVSPSNLLVGYDGAIKVGDFGIARASRRDEAGGVRAKASYMSPEECRGEVIDRRSDVYALGAVLYELATTTRLFKGNDANLIMDQVVNGRIAPPQGRRPDLPPELAAIIMRAVATDRDRRYATADALRVALDQVATTAGLDTSSSAIAVYLRKQFGHRPEPWLDLDPSFSGDDDPATSWPRAAGWSERAGSVGSGTNGTGSGFLVHELATVAVGNPATAHESRADAPLSANAPQQTEAKLGWEAQQRAPARSRYATAIIAVPLLVLLSIGMWRLTAADAPPVVAAVPAPAAPASQPAAAPPAARKAVRMPDIMLQDPDAMAGAKQRTVNAGATRTPPTRSRNPEPARPSTTTTVAALTTANPAVADSPPVEPTRAAPRGEPPAPARTLPPPTRPAAPVASPPAAPPPVVAPPVVAPPVAPAPTPAAPRPVTAEALEANRFAGNKRIVPDSATISRLGNDKLSGTYKMCVTVDGEVSSVTVLTSTGFPAYDLTIRRTIFTTWRYRPYLVNGKPTPVCAAIRFLYSRPPL